MRFAISAHGLINQEMAVSFLPIGLNHRRSGIEHLALTLPRRSVHLCSCATNFFNQPHISQNG